MKSKRLSGREGERRDQARRDAIAGGRAFLRAGDLCARWGVSRVTLWNWQRAGLLPSAVALGPNVKAWSSAAVEAFERRRAGDPEAA